MAAVAGQENFTAAADGRREDRAVLLGKPGSDFGAPRDDPRTDDAQARGECVEVCELEFAAFPLDIPPCFDEGIVARDAGVSRVEKLTQKRADGSGGARRREEDVRVEKDAHGPERAQRRLGFGALRRAARRASTAASRASSSSNSRIRSAV